MLQLTERLVETFSTYLDNSRIFTTSSLSDSSFIFWSRSILCIDCSCIFSSSMQRQNSEFELAAILLMTPIMRCKAAVVPIPPGHDIGKQCVHAAGNHSGISDPRETFPQFLYPQISRTSSEERNTFQEERMVSIRVTLTRTVGVRRSEDCSI